MNRRMCGRGMLAALAVLVALVVPGVASAQAPEVVIGVLYPMTGPVGQTGIDARNAINVALDIINNRHD
ncbi:MAG: amino acid ABC transporter substrate-binding protein, partial [candidate division NC10 bacterium]